MILRYSSAFKRMYRKLSSKQRDLADQALRVFVESPFHPQLRNHKLAGSKQGIRAISADCDLRILYTEEQGHTVVLLLMIGSHDAVY